MKQYNLIFLRDSKVILSRKKYSDWKEVQNDFENYMTSLDFESTENLIEYLSFDYKLSPEIICNVEEIKTTELDQIELNL
jgi:hypothetical protein